jgi:hypothetical protein
MIRQERLKFVEAAVASAILQCFSKQSLQLAGAMWVVEGYTSDDRLCPLMQGQ